jgi:hypothetical protein
VIKTWNCNKNQKCDVVTFWNVTKWHKMSHAFKFLVQNYAYRLRLDFARDASYDDCWLLVYHQTVYTSRSDSLCQSLVHCLPEMSTAQKKMQTRSDLTDEGWKQDTTMTKWKKHICHWLGRNTKFYVSTFIKEYWTLTVCLNMQKYHCV